MTTLTRFGTFNAVLPKSGPKCYPVSLDFRLVGSIDVDMQPEITGGFIDFISGVQVDNRLNANPLEIICQGTGQSLGIPAGKQAYMPLLVSDSAFLTFRSIVNNQLVVPVFILNFPVFPIVF